MAFLHRSLLCLCLAASPVLADGPPPSIDGGIDLLDRGARMLLRSLLDQADPALRDFRDGMGDLVTRMGPALRELAGKIDDLRNYDPPVMLPNGDIILRRRVPLGPPTHAPDGSGQIEL